MAQNPPPWRHAECVIAADIIKLGGSYGDVVRALAAELTPPGVRKRNAVSGVVNRSGGAHAFLERYASAQPSERLHKYLTKAARPPRPARRAQRVLRKPPAASVAAGRQKAATQQPKASLRIQEDGNPTVPLRSHGEDQCFYPVGEPADGMYCARRYRLKRYPYCTQHLMVMYGKLPEVVAKADQTLTA